MKISSLCSLVAADKLSNIFAVDQKSRNGSCAVSKQLDPQYTSLSIFDGILKQNFGVVGNLFVDVETGKGIDPPEVETGDVVCRRLEAGSLPRGINEAGDSRKTIFVFGDRGVTGLVVEVIRQEFFIY